MAILLGLEPEPIRLSIAQEFFEVYKSDGLEVAKSRYAELFPDVANVWDSLAEASIENGDTQRTIELYRKALEIDPKFESAKRGLEAFGGAIE